MAYDIKLVKLVTGELVIGKYNTEKKSLDDVAIMQTVPSQQGVQIAILPYGYPFDQEFGGSIEEKHFLFEYSKVMDEIKDKYLEAVSNLTLSSGGLDPNAVKGGSGLIL